MILEITLQEFPPSINKLYFTHPRGGKAMTDAGKRFKLRGTAQIQREWGPRLTELSPNKPYGVEVYVYFPTIYNKGWPDSAQQKYKKRDVDNLLKLLLDTLSKATGVDDANFLKLLVEKRMDAKNPHIDIRILDLEDG